MPGIYTKYEKVPYRVQKEQNLIVDILKGDHTLTADMKGIKIYDKAGGIDKQSPLLFEIRAFMDSKRSIKERVLGNDLIEKFSRPPYGWHQGAIRAGVAALVRSRGHEGAYRKEALYQSCGFIAPECSQEQPGFQQGPAWIWKRARRIRPT